MRSSSRRGDRLAEGAGRIVMVIHRRAPARKGCGDSWRIRGLGTVKFLCETEPGRCLIDVDAHDVVRAFESTREASEE